MIDVCVGHDKTIDVGRRQSDQRQLPVRKVGGGHFQHLTEFMKPVLAGGRLTVPGIFGGKSRVDKNVPTAIGTNEVAADPDDPAVRMHFE